MVLLSNEEFLNQLMLLAQNARNSSSFTVTLKRYSGNDRPTPREGRPLLPQPETYMCMMRVHSKSRKLSTIIKQHEVPKMMEGYGKLMKVCIDGLKKVKKSKSKAKAAQG